LNTTQKGDQLEDAFFSYLRDEQAQGKLLLDQYPGYLCTIHKKKKYPGSTRSIQFDVVVEVRAQGRPSVSTYVVFECKNHTHSLSDSLLRDFSSRLTEAFGHSHKGFMVFTSRLQRGARQFAEERKIGLIKFDKHGIEFELGRTTSASLNPLFFHAQFSEEHPVVKPLKFCAYDGLNFYASIRDLIATSHGEGVRNHCNAESVTSHVSYLPDDVIADVADKTLKNISYVEGPVDLTNILSSEGIELLCSEDSIRDSLDNELLGTANFSNRTITVHAHSNRHRQRFTIAHEIGHFVLEHEKHLRSDTIVRSDLFISDAPDVSFFYRRLEAQANVFASQILMPREGFLKELHIACVALEIKNRGHGFIYVDDQPVNLKLYYKLLAHLSSTFDVSQYATEIRLKRMNLLTDRMTSCYAASNSGTFSHISGLNTPLR
jgi:Zn-dependent peptidase ImmA (M78 family)